MKSTFFYNKNGSLSSIRTSSSIGAGRVENTSYIGSGKGGMTYRGKSITSRLNTTGQSISIGTGFGTKQYYNGKTFTTNIGKY